MLCNTALFNVCLCTDITKLIDIDQMHNYPLYMCSLGFEIVSLKGDLSIFVTRRETTPYDLVLFLFDTQRVDKYMYVGNTKVQ